MMMKQRHYLYLSCVSGRPMAFRMRGATLALTLLFLFWGLIPVSSQNTKLDSLKSLTSSSGSLNPNQHIDLINKLAYELRVSYPDVAMSASQKALSLSKKNNHKVGESDAHITLGLLYWLTPEYER